MVLVCCDHVTSSCFETKVSSWWGMDVGVVWGPCGGGMGAYARCGGSVLGAWGSSSVLSAAQMILVISFPGSYKTYKFCNIQKHTVVHFSNTIIFFIIFTQTKCFGQN